MSLCRIAGHRNQVCAMPIIPRVPQLGGRRTRTSPTPARRRVGVRGRNQRRPLQRQRRPGVNLRPREAQHRLRQASSWMMFPRKPVARPTPLYGSTYRRRSITLWNEQHDEAQALTCARGQQLLRKTGDRKPRRIRRNQPQLNTRSVHPPRCDYRR